VLMQEGRVVAYSSR
jgi:hypothetical protein